MKRTFLLLLTLLATSLLAAPEEKRTIYFSLVEKDSIASCLNRIVTPHYHITATLSPVADAMDSVAVSEKQGQELYFVEAFSHMLPPLPEEILRFDNIIIISLPASSQIHSHYPRRPDLYMEKIAAHPKQFVTQSASLSRDLTQLATEVKDYQLDIDQQYLREKLAALTGEKEVTVNGETFRIGERRSDQGKANARKYLQAEYQKLGFSVSFHQYQHFSKGYNVIAEKQGEDPSKYFVVSAHYDTVNTAGADDDASGVVAGLAIAQALQNFPLKHNLRIVAFDDEEWGLIGSKAYAKALHQNGELENFLGLIQLEMLGYDADSDGGYHVIDCSENNSAYISDLVMRTVAKKGIALHLVPACTNRSDHASFWRYNKPAIVISQNFFGGDSNPCYHRSCDKLDLLDLEYMSKITAAVANTVANILVKDVE